MAMANTGLETLANIPYILLGGNSINFIAKTYSTIPNINDPESPMKILAGWKLKNKKPKVVLTWAPHIKPIPQCVTNSFSEWMTTWGEANFVITHPEGYELSTEFTNGATITHNQDEALKDADFIYVKNWSSYHNYGKVLTTDDSWMLTNAKLSKTNDAKVMHCLPVRRNVELSDEILDGANSLVTKEASNRVWAAQAVLSEILKNNS